MSMIREIQQTRNNYLLCVWCNDRYTMIRNRDDKQIKKKYCKTHGYDFIRGFIFITVFV